MTPSGRQQTSRTSKSLSTSSWPKLREQVRAPRMECQEGRLASWTRCQTPGWRCSGGSRWRLGIGHQQGRAQECSTWETLATSTPLSRCVKMSRTYCLMMICYVIYNEWFRLCSTPQPWWTIWDLVDMRIIVAAMLAPPPAPSASWQPHWGAHPVARQWSPSRSMRS